MRQTIAQRQERPGIFEMLTHFGRALRLAGALLRDRRVSFLRKLVFIVPLVVMLIALLAPETAIAGFVGAVLPVVGPAVDIPADAAIDWLSLGLLSFGLMRVFPLPVLDEHYQRIFHHAQVR
jgi:hypothetical protein